jgi:hypothetical protein
MANSEDEFHSRAEIWDYVLSNYPALAAAKDMSIGVVGGIYRVAVVDGVDGIHTIRIDPKQSI